jgi:hypothetical protein
MSAYIQVHITAEGLCSLRFLIGELHKKFPSSLSLTQLHVLWRRSLRKACSGRKEFNDLMSVEEVCAKSSNYAGDIIEYILPTPEKLKEFCDLLKTSGNCPLPFTLDYDGVLRRLAAMKASLVNKEK